MWTTTYNRNWKINTTDRSCVFNPNVETSHVNCGKGSFVLSENDPKNNAQLNCRAEHERITHPHSHQYAHTQKKTTLTLRKTMLNKTNG